jgi:hypothetical protein
MLAMHANVRSNEIASQPSAMVSKKNKIIDATLQNGRDSLTQYVSDAGIGPSTSHRQGSSCKPSMTVANLLELLMMTLQLLIDKAKS